jgi:ABC-type transport system involved in multi-copper enzyme maturation permease subunit
MISALKAEFTKLLTIRSTYFLTLFVCIVIAGISIYSGWNASMSVSMNLSNFIFGGLQLVGFVAAIVAVLMVAHEYRYNVITYSFTLSNNRGKVLIGKFAAASAYAVVLCLLAIGLIVGGLQLGAAWHGGALVFQDVNWLEVFGRALYYVWGYGMIALVATLLLRNLVGSIAFLFIFPSLEQLAGLILKSNIGYLPFMAHAGISPLGAAQGSFSVGKSAIIFAVYIVVFSAIAWFATLKRDAN